MIEFFSSWTKTLGFAIVVVSILEMLLPNNKTKKYIKMVMGIYILFTIISPFITNKEIFNINNINFEDYVTQETSSNLNQVSVSKKIEEMYIDELEKDITKKLTKQGYEIKNCDVNAKISDNEEETKINKIKIKAIKSENKANSEEEMENKIITEIQKIKPVEINTKSKNEDIEKLSKTDIQNIKKFLIDEYGVNEKCLEIN